mmetsp:Transcript_4180/g.6310  ORF Transcript_4180/g.6310 Transcript_4180/m.6310 type:complete len:269 (+) Transcript_4180:72-878(+)
MFENEEKEERQEFRIKVLRILHLVASIWMLALTIIFAVLELDVDVSIVVNFPDQDDRDGAVGSPDQETIGKAEVSIYLSVFCALAAADHFVCAMLGFFKQEFVQKWLFEYQANPLRWIEYSFSASIMAVLVAMVTGVYDIHLQFSIGLSTAICMMTGFIVEIGFPREMDSWRIKTAAYSVYILGFIACFGPWLVILCYFFESSGAPTFVYFIIFGELIAFAAFGINMFGYFFMKWWNFSTYEGVYIILSFTAKTFLAFVTYGGFKSSE